jgi:hypothetical protein
MLKNLSSSPITSYPSFATYISFICIFCEFKFEIWNEHFIMKGEAEHSFQLNFKYLLIYNVK